MGNAQCGQVVAEEGFIVDEAGSLLVGGAGGASTQVRSGGVMLHAAAPGRTWTQGQPGKQNTSDSANTFDLLGTVHSLPGV